MHPKLIESLKQFEAHFKQDPRCLGMYLHGSIGRGTTDEYSDVDVSIVIKDENYPEIRQELRPLCEKICGPIAAWLPEGESDGYCNHAFLFEHEKSILLYDFATIKESFFIKNAVHEDVVLFNRMEAVPARPPEQTSSPFSTGALAQYITNYWVYVYLIGKYTKREDLYKLLYVRDVLFHTHMKVLNYLHPDHDWVWWAGEIQNLPDEKQQQLLVYFRGAAVNDILAELERELTMFSLDAAEACKKYNLQYPAHTETAVRQHLNDMGTLLSTS